MPDTRILLVESDSAFFNRLERIFEQARNIRIIGYAPNWRSAARLIKEYPYDALLLDMDLPDGSGLNLIRLSKELNPRVPIQIITRASDDPFVISAIECGANGYLLKSFDNETIVDNIRLAIAGGAAVSAEVAQNVIRAFGKHLQQELRLEPLASMPQLSQRESEILMLLGQGLNSDAIATVLTISPHTVLAHVKKIYKKLGVHSRAQAICQAQAYLAQVARHNKP